MKCPKCGYNSFEFLDACKKCGAELGTFKKAHRISTVIRPAVAVPTERPLPEAPPAVAQAPVLQENLHENFDLGFPDSPQDEVNDKEFTGFSFSDEPVPPAQDNIPAASEVLEDDFSFGEPEEEESTPSSWDIQFDETGSGLDKYERILAPESLDDGTDQPGENDLKVAENFESFGTSDFDFAPESLQEDIFAGENEPDLPTPAEKKPKPNLEDFDKEFEMIFAEEDPAEPGEKTS